MVGGGGGLEVRRAEREGAGGRPLLTAGRTGGLRGGNVSASEPGLRAGAGAAMPQGTCDFVLMLPRYPEGTARMEGPPLAGRSPWMRH